MQLSREAIQRMIGDRIGGGGVGGVGGFSPAILAGYATETWVNDNYLSIEFFSKLFKAYDSAATPNEITPNDTESTITNIKAMFGFWTEQYVSALGQNAGGGGSLSMNEPLASINSANLGTPSTSGQVITWDGTQWVYAVPGGGSGGGVTQITAGTGLSGGTITSVGTIAINSTYQDYIAHGQTAYGWGDHANAGYATQSWVGQQGYLTSSSISDMATKTWVGQQGFVTSVSGTIWGQSFSNGGTITGSMSNVGAVFMNSHLYMNAQSSSSGGRGLMVVGYEADGTIGKATFGFHEANSSSWASSAINLQLILDSASGAIASRYVRVYDGLRIGDGMLMWDSTNNAFKVIKADGTAANMYATGGVSALGMSAGASSVDAMTFSYLNVNNMLKVKKNNYSADIYVNNSGTLCVETYNGMWVENTLTVNDAALDIEGDGSLNMNGNYIYLTSSVYIHTDGSDLLINISGTDYKLTKTAA